MKTAEEITIEHAKKNNQPLARYCQTEGCGLELERDEVKCKQCRIKEGQENA